MRRRCRHALLTLLLAPILGCEGTPVVREGDGWRELAVDPEGATRVEVTTTDPRILAQIARTHPDVRLRAEALDRVKDPEVVAEVARKDAEPLIRKKALERVDDGRVAAAIASADADAGVRNAAEDRCGVLLRVDRSRFEYAGWASCAPGSWVRLRIDFADGSEEIARKLLRVTPESAFLEQRAVRTGWAPEGPIRSILERLENPGLRRDGGEKDLEISGRSFQTRWVKYVNLEGDVLVRVWLWSGEGVPGGVLKIHIEEVPEGHPVRHLHGNVTAWELAEE